MQGEVLPKSQEIKGNQSSKFWPLMDFLFEMFSFLSFSLFSGLYQAQAKGIGV